MKKLLNNSSSTNFMLAFALAAFAMTLPLEGIAAAASTTASIFEGVVCNIVRELQGPIARAIAAFGIIFLGFSLFLGKISWGVALAIGIGIGAILGAGQIVSVMTKNTPNGGQAC